MEEKEEKRKGRWGGNGTRFHTGIHGQGGGRGGHLPPENVVKCSCVASVV